MPCGPLLVKSHPSPIQLICPRPPSKAKNSGPLNPSPKVPSKERGGLSHLFPPDVTFGCHRHFLGKSPMPALQGFQRPYSSEMTGWHVTQHPPSPPRCHRSSFLLSGGPYLGGLEARDGGQLIGPGVYLLHYSRKPHGPQRRLVGREKANGNLRKLPRSWDRAWSQRREKFKRQ